VGLPPAKWVDHHRQSTLNVLNMKYITIVGYYGTGAYPTVKDGLGITGTWLYSLLAERPPTFDLFFLTDAPATR
jgi:hypothetical protein